MISFTSSTTKLSAKITSVPNCLLWWNTGKVMLLFYSSIICLLVFHLCYKMDKLISFPSASISVISTFVLEHTNISLFHQHEQNYIHPPPLSTLNSQWLFPFGSNWNSLIPPMHMINQFLNAITNLTNLSVTHTLQEPSKSDIRE